MYASRPSKDIGRPPSFENVQLLGASLQPDAYEKAGSYGVNKLCENVEARSQKGLEAHVCVSGRESGRLGHCYLSSGRYNIGRCRSAEILNYTFHVMIHGLRCS